MDLRNLPDGLSAAERIGERRARIEQELTTDLSLLHAHEKTIGMADEKNCEQMFGQVPIPVGYAGPLFVNFSSNQQANIHLPLATTEAALVASVNRGCKAVTMSGGAHTTHIRHGVTRSMAFRVKDVEAFTKELEQGEAKWKEVGTATSNHLEILSYDIESQDDHVFLTIACDTDEAMGMNMVTIAAQAIGQWVVENIKGSEFITVAGNVDSDKKPSTRTHIRGRGYEARAEAHIPSSILSEVLKVTPEQVLAVAHAKLDIGSTIAGALGHNLHAANIIAALFLATGQDPAHVVEGSLADTSVKAAEDGIRILVRLPALLVGVRGGGTELPAQAQCLDLLLQPETSLHACAQLAESIAAAVLAGEVSLLAAQAGHTLAKAHSDLAR